MSYPALSVSSRTFGVRHTRRRRLRLWLAAITVAVLLPLFPDGLLVSTANAGVVTVDPGECSTSNGCGAAPGPAPLLSAAALAAATPAQATALQAFEKAAVDGVIRDHGLSSSDFNAVQSWGRSDAEAELWTLIVQAISTPTASRSFNQQQVVNWMGGLDAAEQNQAAVEAGAQYTKWAGLDVNDYWRIAGTASQNQLSAFLSSDVRTYDTPDTAHATGGYCVYRPPAPYDTEYNAAQTPTCFAPCTSVLGCTPQTPSYDQFVKWGVSAATYAETTSPAFQNEAMSIAAATSVVDGLVGAGGTAVVASALPAATLESMASTLFPLMAGPESFSAGATIISAAGAAEAVSAAAFVIGIAVFAIVTLVLQGIQVFANAKLPVQIAQLVVGGRSAIGDPAARLASDTGRASLYALFVGATMPAPSTDATCVPPSPTNGTGISTEFLTLLPLGTPTLNVAGVITPLQNPDCLNPPAIPAATPADPHFVITPQAGAGSTVPSISVADTAHQTTSTVRVVGNWFVQQLSGAGQVNNVQTLALDYTDWTGAQQRATLLHTATGYVFVGVSTPVGGANSSVNPSTCAAAGTCWKSSQIKYLGTDGKHYSATVAAYIASVGTPSYSPARPVEASTVTFNANNFSAANATHASQYTWRFQSLGCGFVNNACTGTLGDLGQPSYGDPMGGAQVSFIWQAPGIATVELTANDNEGHVATTTFQVPIAGGTPTVTMTPDCVSAPTPCDGRDLNAGQQLTLTGSLVSVGTGDTENIVVRWGDGTSDAGTAGILGSVLYNPNLTFSRSDADRRLFSFSGVHIYNGPGVYFGTVSASDAGGGTAVGTFTARVTGPSQIIFPALGDQTNGTTLQLGATGSSSGQPVTYTATPASVCVTSGLTGATLSMVGLGQCTVTANQAAVPPLFGAAPPVQQTFTVNEPPPLAPQTAPIITSVVAADGSATVTFTPAAGGYPAPNYKLSAAPTTGGVPVVFVSDVTSPVTVSGLTNGVAYKFQIVAVNASGTTTSAPTLATRIGVPATITGTPPASATVGTAYSFGYTVTGAPAPTLTVAGNLPPGLTVSNDGTISGTPTAAGTFLFTVLAKNFVGTIISDPVTITVRSAPGAPTIGGAIGGDGSASVTFTPGTAGYPTATTFDVTATPASGTPVTAANVTSPVTVFGLTNGIAYTFTVTATNSAGSSTSTASDPVTIGVATAISGTPPASATVGTAYTFGYTLKGRPAPTVTIESGALPDGLTLNNDGTIAGTPTTAGTFTFTVKAANALAAQITDTATITVAPAPVAPGAPTITGATGADSSATVAFTPGTVGYPAATTFDLTATPVTGTPVTARNVTSPATVSGLTNGVAYTFTVTAKNGVGDGTASAKSASVTIGAAATITGTPTATATAGTPYTFSYILGGKPAPTTTIASGTLPAGLSLSTDGKLTGTPTTAGTSTFTVKATNSVGTQTTTSASITVTAGSPATVVITGGNTQSAAASATFASPLAVSVSDAYGNPIPNARVTFAVASGSATLTGTNPATTTAAGTASVGLKAGTTAGPVTVTATVGSGTTAVATTFMETVTASGTAKADLAVAISGATTVTAGQPVTVTVTVTNKGPSAASNILAGLYVPTRAGKITAVSTGGRTANGLALFTTTSLASGAKVTYTVTITAGNMKASNIIAAGVLSGTQDPGYANNLGLGLLTIH